MELTADTIELYAIQHYTNEFCTGKEEFLEDYERFLLVKKIIRRYLKSDQVNIRLLLNHVIAVGNVFEVSSASEMFIFLMDKPEEKKVIRTILLYLGYIRNDEYKEYAVDFNIIEMIRKATR